MAAGRDDDARHRRAGPTHARGFADGLFAVPYWVVTILLLAVVLAVVLTALIFIPAAQRPTLQPPSPAVTTGAR
jgi:hypothetical protein